MDKTIAPFHAIPRLLQAGGFCYSRLMMTHARRTTLTLLTAVTLLTSVPAQAGYEDGLKAVRNAKYHEAMAEFLPLAQEGHSGSQFSMGLMYHLGRGVQKDLEVAYDWYKKAAMQEYPAALNNIGMMYLNGEYVAANEDIAFKLFEKAATDHIQALDNLGRCYENGWGVEKDVARAIDYYTMAGDAGYMLGYFHIGELYERGHPPEFPKNVDKAVNWYIKAAEKKFTRARNRLIELGRLPAALR